MTGRLWFKLMSAFVLVIGVGILVTVWVARQNTVSQFSHIMVNGQAIDPGEVVATLAAAYAQSSSWQEADQVLDSMVNIPGGMMGGMMDRGMMGMMGGGRLLVADQAGRVVADSRGQPAGQIDEAALAQGLPIQVEGTRVGTLLVDGPVMTMAGTVDPAILSAVSRAVWLAGLIAGGVALLLAGALVRQLTRPVSALSDAARRIAQGERDVAVPVRGGDELGELATAFNRMSASLASQETQRRALMADVAHELRTPLAGIQGTVEALQDGVFPLTQENLAPIQEQTALLSRLVDDLRTLANAEAGQIELDLRPVDVANLARRTVAMHQGTAAAHGVSVTATETEALPTIQADAQRIEQVLSNLLANALRHTPDGGTVELQLSAGSSGTSSVRLAVMDSGEGILAQDLPHIFERFYRADRSRSRATGGTGLGLAIAQQLVHLHGGRIRAESPPPGRDRGTVFTVEL